MPQNLGLEVLGLDQGNS
ncbi:hypothetical protein Gohar_024810 [Gossypium harknessii]|uniref:Uncharacterized protein n=1 Tax=Gossypium harknessii TaxID=34285 RepID=A0A7J9HJQ4_9ROSI|nr:hypothetical protein [Gossypium harknessii]